MSQACPGLDPGNRNRDGDRGLCQLILHISHTPTPICINWQRYISLELPAGWIDMGNYRLSR
jgi:hypothetical protein